MKYVYLYNEEEMIKFLPIKEEKRKKSTGKTHSALQYAFFKQVRRGGFCLWAFSFFSLFIGKKLIFSSSLKNGHWQP
jgi:hypothetical protein